MSKQRYLLILILLSCIALPAQLRFQNELELGVNGNSDSAELVLRDRLHMAYDQGSRFRLSIENDLLRRDFKVDDLALTRYNSFTARASYRIKDTVVKSGFRNTLFGDADKMALFPIALPMMAYDKQMQNYAYLALEQSLGAGTIGLSSSVRALDLKPWEYSLDPNTFELIAIEKADDRLIDYLSELYFGYDPYSSTTLYARYAHHYSDLDGESRSLLAQSEIGIEYDDELFDKTKLSASFDWQNRQGDIRFAERSNLYNTRMRVHYQLNPFVNFSLAYYNHLCSDPRLSQLLLISNLINGTAKYSYSYDLSGASYTALAVKYSPENKASAIMADTDFRASNHFWVGAETLYFPDSFAEYRLKATYRFGAYNSLKLVYEYKNSMALSSHAQEISLGYFVIY